jgi:hypothetical protein
MRENSASSHESEKKRSLSRERPPPKTNIYKRRDSSQEIRAKKESSVEKKSKPAPKKVVEKPRGRALVQTER